jgi:A/G-specific adenine glycosylase
VAEVMLQQTQVATVLRYYGRFLERFPDPASLARASEDEVLSLWSGLGYYRRARALQAGARSVIERHDGKVPADPTELIRLPGIGRYTAGAIASTAFGLCEPVLDGNVRRVLSRLFAVDERRLGRGRAERKLWAIAAELAHGPAPGDLNQALMELGALVCSPRQPKCTSCPVATGCRAHASADPERLPAPRTVGPTRRLRVAVAVVRRSHRVLLERPGDGNPLRGRWDLPAVELDEDATVERVLGEALRLRHDILVQVGPLVARASHGIMRNRLGLEIHDCRLHRGRVSGNSALRWIEPADLSELPVSGATRKALRLGASPPRRSTTTVTRRQESEMSQCKP